MTPDGRILAQGGPRLTGLTLATTHAHRGQPGCRPVAAELPEFQNLAAQPPGPHGPGWCRSPGTEKSREGSSLSSGAGRGTRVGTKCSLCQGSKDRPPQICRVLGPKELNVEEKRG